MNLILVEPAELDGDTLVLTDHRAEHIVKVLRAQVGDTLRLGLVDGALGRGVVLALAARHPRRVTLQVTFTRLEVALPPLDLALTLSRPIMMRRIFSQHTALGVGCFHVLNAGRVEKSFWEASFITAGEYRQHLLRGLEQAVDTRLPKVHFYRRFSDFVKAVQLEFQQRYAAMLLAHPAGSSCLAETVPDGVGRILMLIGPEGGWLEPEVAQLQAAGCCPVTLGPRILRVDTAAVALHARISERLGQVERQ